MSNMKLTFHVVSAFVLLGALLLLVEQVHTSVLSKSNTLANHFAH